MLDPLGGASFDAENQVHFPHDALTAKLLSTAGPRGAEVCSRALRRARSLKHLLLSIL